MIVLLYCIRNVDAVHKHIHWTTSTTISTGKIYTRNRNRFYSYSTENVFSSRRQFCRYILWFEIAKKCNVCILKRTPIPFVFRGIWINCICRRYIVIMMMMMILQFFHSHICRRVESFNHKKRNGTISRIWFSK